MTYLFANWKMYLHADEALELAKQAAGFEYDSEKTKIAIFPPMISLSEIINELKGSNVSSGAQNVAWTPMGAYTGATSALLAQKAGCRYALVGHSERRYVFHETDQDVRKKIEACIDANITPVLCIGETKQEKETGEREERLKEQLEIALREMDITSSDDLIIAYEPVWAIAGSGTGEACTPQDVEEVHDFILNCAKALTGHDHPILYGGSVTSENVVSYLSLAHVNGVLVGSASTHVDSFKSLLEACNKI